MSGFLSPSAGASTRATPTRDDKGLVGSVTASDEDLATVSAISNTPPQDGEVEVEVNGQAIPLGDGAKDKFAYFSGDGGTTPRLKKDITAGDELYWMGSIAGFELDASDVIDFDYDINV